jgi:transaldolase
VKLYLDSADERAWALPGGCPPVQGVTTNPSLVHQAGLPVTLATYERLLLAAAAQGMAELMLQLPRPDPAEALAWQATLAERASQLGVLLTLKLPCHPQWLPSIQALRPTGQTMLLTGLANPVQLLWARAQGAHFVAPYVGRLVADGREVWSLMQACVTVQSAGGPALLAASIKSPDVLTRLIACGAAAATLPPASLVAWSHDELTLTAMGQFDRDTQASLQI